MTEAKERPSETVETAICKGKPSGHDVRSYEDGVLWANELGDTGVDAGGIWDVIAEGKAVTLVCRDCDALLSVSLKVSVRR